MLVTLNVGTLVFVDPEVYFSFPAFTAAVGKQFVAYVLSSASGTATLDRNATANIGGTVVTAAQSTYMNQHSNCSKRSHHNRNPFNWFY